MNQPGTIELTYAPHTAWLAYLLDGWQLPFIPAIDPAPIPMRGGWLAKMLTHEIRDIGLQLPREAGVTLWRAVHV